jgi:HAMP domain-containing protein
MSTSVHVPWVVGLSLLLLIAAAAAVAGLHRPDAPSVTGATLDNQERVALSAAGSARVSLNETMHDLETASALLSHASAADVATTLAEMRRVNERWFSLVVVDRETGAVLQDDGGATAAGLLGDRVPRGAGLRVQPTPTGVRLVAFAPLDRAGAPPAVLVGEVRPEVLAGGLEVARPGDAWLVAGKATVVTDLEGGRRMATLPSSELRRAASRAAGLSSGAARSGGSSRTADVVSWAPITGDGPAGSLGWGVVVDRSVSDLTSTGYDYRIPALAFALLLVGAALLAFLWIRVSILVPVRHLQEETERIVYGDLAVPVRVTSSHREFSTIATALERLRHRLLHDRRDHGPRDYDSSQTLDLRGLPEPNQHRRRLGDPPAEWLGS